MRSCLTLCGNPGNPITQIVTGGSGSQAPGAPTLNPATVNGSQISLSWTPAPAPSPQPDYYVVQELGAAWTFPEKERSKLPFESRG